MASRACLVAVNRTIRAADLDEAGSHAALIDFARNLARRVDAVGPDEAPLNLLRLYDSAVTKLERLVAPRPVVKAPRDAGDVPVTEAAVLSGPPKLEIVKESALERIRKSKARAVG